MSKLIPGVLFIYNHPYKLSASTIMEHVNAFDEHSRFKIWYVNTYTGFPRNLPKLRFSTIVLHYSIFGSNIFRNGKDFIRYLQQCQDSYKIAFFQDEYMNCPERFAFLNYHKIDCVFTLVGPDYFKDTYGKYTQVPKLIYNITGYVSETLIATAQRLAVPDDQRTIDVGYRARPLAYYMGRGAQEKTEIAHRFRELAKGCGLKLDIETEEHNRIYGENWYHFVANCRATLGVESGVSIFDLEGTVYQEYRRLVTQNPKISFAEMSEKLNFQQLENRIPYRTISPRHFEAAAFRVCQILYEGEYSGILKPMVHYIPLKKDFSNFDEVICRFRDVSLRRELTENAFRDLIASGNYSYQAFIQKTFDPVLFGAGLKPEITEKEIDLTTSLLNKDLRLRWLWGAIISIPDYLPQPINRRLVQIYRKWTQTHI
jgi:hypothetical protein